MPDDTPDVSEYDTHKPALSAIARALSSPVALISLLQEAHDHGHAIVLLRDRYGFSALEATAVLDLQFHTVTAAVRGAIIEESSATSIPDTPPA